MNKPHQKRLHVAFLHPDLGLGGAERLVMDMASSFEKLGHNVCIFTSGFDPEHCLAPALKMDVRIAGKWIPPAIFNRFRMVCSLFRMTACLCSLVKSGQKFDYIVCDLVPQIIPLIRILSSSKIIYYCHFPDQLLTPPGNLIYRLYRFPFDALEIFSLNLAHKVLVNSEFTGSVLEELIPRLRNKARILYPCVHPDEFKKTGNTRQQKGEKIILSLNRFDPVKNLGLAVKALGFMKGKTGENEFRQIKLILAGGFDPRLRSHEDTVKDLKKQIRRLGLEASVEFQFSISDQKRLELIRASDVMIYTSLHEHFGIGILESMAAGIPVVAVNSGGPIESVIHRETGYLCDPAPDTFGGAILQLLSDDELAKSMSQAGIKRAADFSFEKFTHRLESIIAGMQ